MLYGAVLSSLPVKMYYCTIAYLNIIAKLLQSTSVGLVTSLMFSLVKSSLVFVLVEGC